MRFFCEYRGSEKIRKREGLAVREDIGKWALRAARRRPHASRSVRKSQKRWHEGIEKVAGS